MRLVLTNKIALRVHLVPRLGAQDVMHILDPVVSPNRIMHAPLPHRLERIVHVRQRDPPVAPQLRHDLLVGKVHAVAVALNLVDNLPVQHLRGTQHRETAVHHGDGAAARIGALALRALRIGRLAGKCAVFRDPCRRVVRLLERVARADVARGKDASRRAAAAAAGVVAARLAAAERGGGFVERNVHELVHVAQHQHVRVELHDAVVLGQRKGGQLGKGVGEARVRGGGKVARADGRVEVVDALRGDAPGGERGEAGGRKGVGVEGEERVCGLDLSEGVVERQDAGEVVHVGNERGPDCFVLATERAGISWFW